MNLRLVLSVTVLSCATAQAQVIGWRGDGTGVMPADCKPVTEWDGKTGKSIVWKTPLPNHGTGSPIVVSKKVIVVCEPGYPAGVAAPLLMCFDADTGKELWRQQMDPFVKLPQAQREQVTALRAEYWDLLRKLHTMYVEWEDSTDEARKAVLQAEARKLFGQPFDKRTDS